jgi:hypothetical protein
MRNPIDETRPQVVMPMKYLTETKNAPERRLSFPLFSEMVSFLALFALNDSDFFSH